MWTLARFQDKGHRPQPEGIPSLSEKPFVTMKDPRRKMTLLIEHGTRSAVVNGKRVKLAHTDFALLATLASSPGEVIPHQELTQEAFGGPMAPHDLHWRIWRLRDLLGDRERELKILENRRGHGYFLALAPEAVTVTHGPDSATEFSDDEVSEPIALEPEPQGIPSLETAAPVLPASHEEPPTLPARPEKPPASALSESHDEPSTDEADGEVPYPLQNRTHRISVRLGPVLVASLVALAALGGSWSVGYLLAAKRGADSEVQSASQLPQLKPSPSPSEAKAKAKDAPERKGQKRRPKNGAQDKRPTKSKKDRPGEPSGATVVAAPASSGEVANPAPEPEPKTNGGNGSGDSKPQPVAPALPPAPTRYLYHLVHPETGDHFVTTDSATASEQEAKGYRGSAIARVYTSQESGTRALTTNQGTAWIFTSAGPKTEPASRPVPLWYSTNDAGDFFYTTSESEAKASGWSASLAGYARAL